MGKINLLDSSLSNMIAAGEVIERPSSVIKELVENSIDASATMIEVALYDGGRRNIIVSDNGEGMDRRDAQLALKRHATSKISTEFDLFRIKTLGFRGEALPSIASVSRFHMLTSDGQSVGSEISAFEDEIECRDASSKQGTTITVAELFYNTPARLKYLKSDYIENASSLEVMARLALAHPSIAFSFTIDEKLQFKTTGRGQQLEAILNIYGAMSATNMLPITFVCPDFKISGYLGKPDIAKSNRYYIVTLLNGRSVFMPKVQTAIIEAYRDFLAPVRFPFVVLNFEIEPALVDVNVHPSKREIRFSKEEALRQVLLDLIPTILSGTPLLAAAPLNKEGLNRNERSIVDEPQSLLETEVAYGQYSFDEIAQSQNIKPSLVFQAIGQMHGTYIVAVDEHGGFVLVDQHAAAERINYEKFKHLASINEYIISPIVPLIIDMKPSEDALVTPERLAVLKQTGVLLEPFGIHSYKVVEIPIWAKEFDERQYVEQLLDDVLHQDKFDPLKIRDEAIAMKSCKRSLKANQRLSIGEMQALIDKLLTCQHPYTCPHGRPTIVSFSKYDLEKMFKRTGF